MNKSEKHFRSYQSPSGTTVRAGFKQYMWCPLSHPSQSNIFSGSTLRRQSLQRAFNAERFQVILLSTWPKISKFVKYLIQAKFRNAKCVCLPKNAKWTYNWEKLVQACNDSSHLSSGVRTTGFGSTKKKCVNKTATYN